MMRRRLGVLLATASSVFFGATAPSSPAAASTEGPCPSASGVTVVIDFHELGGGVHVRCAAGPVTSGFEALRLAGINYDTATRSQGFLCRIAGQPAADPCINTSPASAYWSYWLAPRGGSWCYSGWGAGSRVPPEGTVEGWSFAKDKQGSTVPAPGIAPPAAVAGSPATLPARDCDAARPLQGATPTPTAPPTGVQANPSTTSPQALPAAGPAPATVGAAGAASSGAAPRGATPSASSPAAPNRNPAATASGAPPDPGGAELAARPEGAADTTATPTAAPAGDVASGTAGDTATDEPAAATAAANKNADENAVATERAAEAVTVDLDGGDRDGTPVGVIVTGGALGVGASAAFLLKRRGRTV
ncbi:MAG: hypothetical protein GX868_06650 [Actinobacteria bacterium]|nr:hypothetical protein [Actinomycetota bacterium]